jgi:hypothetical protein
MIFWLHHSIPVLCHPVVIVLWAVQLVVGKRQLVLRSSDRIRVRLIPKVDVRYVKVVRHSISFVVFTTTGQQKMDPKMYPLSYLSKEREKSIVWTWLWLRLYSPNSRLKISNMNSSH